MSIHHNIFSQKKVHCQLFELFLSLLHAILKLNLETNSLKTFPKTLCLSLAAKQCVASLESELENAKTQYNNNMEDFKERLQAEARKLGNCVEKARPLYEAQKNMRRCQVEVQKVSMQYRKSQNLKDSAKQMVKAAELKHEQCRNEIRTGIEAGKDMTALQMQLMDQMNQSLEMETKAADSANLLQVKHGKTHEQFIDFQQRVTGLDKTNAVKNLDMARSYMVVFGKLVFWAKTKFFVVFRGK